MADPKTTSKRERSDDPPKYSFVDQIQMVINFINDHVANLGKVGIEILHPTGVWMSAINNFLDMIAGKMSEKRSDEDQPDCDVYRTVRSLLYDLILESTNADQKEDSRIKWFWKEIRACEWGFTDEGRKTILEYLQRFTDVNLPSKTDEQIRMHLPRVLIPCFLRWRQTPPGQLRDKIEDEEIYPFNKSYEEITYRARFYNAMISFNNFRSELGKLKVEDQKRLIRHMYACLDYTVCGNGTFSPPIPIGCSSTEETIEQLIRDAKRRFYPNSVDENGFNDCWLYVIETEDGCYYIGRTIKDPRIRFGEHINGEACAKWLKEHKPKRVVELHWSSRYYEDGLTVYYMKQYGIDKVRGGIFSYVTLDDDDQKIVQRMWNNADHKFRGYQAPRGNLGVIDEGKLPSSVDKFPLPLPSDVPPDEKELNKPKTDAKPDVPAKQPTRLVAAAKVEIPMPLPPGMPVLPHLPVPNSAPSGLTQPRSREEQYKEVIAKHLDQLCQSTVKIQGGKYVNKTLGEVLKGPNSNYAFFLLTQPHQNGYVLPLVNEIKRICSIS